MSREARVTEQARMQIGEVARRAQVNIRTLHYYESRGLLPRPQRTNSNYRIYPEDSVRRVRFIKRAQELGFTLDEIKELLALRMDSGASRGDIRTRAVSKVLDIKEKIRTLQAMQRALEKLTDACSGEGSVCGCPILESIANNGNSRELQPGEGV